MTINMKTKIPKYWRTIVQNFLINERFCNMCIRENIPYTAILTREHVWKTFYRHMWE